MRRVREQLRRFAAPLFLIGLLLVPVVASGHSHGAHPTAQPCAICVVTHHTPAVSAPPVAAPANVPIFIGIELVAFAIPCDLARSQPSVRGPPLLLQDV